MTEPALAFAVGDRVRCVDASDTWDLLRQGEVYTVAGVRHWTIALREVSKNEGEWWFYSRFVKDSPPQPEPHQFVVGDRVKCIDAAGTRSLKEGDVYTVVAVGRQCISIREIEDYAAEWFHKRFVKAPAQEPTTARARPLPTVQELAAELYRAWADAPIINKGGKSDWHVVAEAAFRAILGTVP